MNVTSREEVIFESADESSAADSEHKLSSYKTGVIDRPVGYHNGDIAEVKLNPEAAFGVFNGKVFYQQPVEYYSLADAIEKRAESPMQRFARLRGELDELKADLDAMMESEAAGGKVNSTWSVLQQEAIRLVSQSAALSSHPGFDLLRSSASSQDRALSGIVQSIADVSITDSEGRAQEANPVAANKRAVGTMDAEELVALEQRVYRLEALLGSSANLSDLAASSCSPGSTAPGSVLLGIGQGCPYPLLATVRRLEERAALLDAAELEGVRAKCEALRTEVDSTVKSKAALSAEAKVVEATRQLAGLLAVAEKAGAVAEDLPALALRLKTLEHVHSAASGFAGRLVQMEGDVRALGGQLSSNKEVLAELKSSLRENLAAMQQNVTAVNAKIAALQQE